jgi:hypothetical protein
MRSAGDTNRTFSTNNRKVKTMTKDDLGRQIMAAVYSYAQLNHTSIAASLAEAQAVLERHGAKPKAGHKLMTKSEWQESLSRNKAPKGLMGWLARGKA